MILSMTGYGKSVFKYKEKTVDIEVRSLNSKNLDVNVRIPGIYKEKEIEIRRIIAENLSRGKVDLLIYITEDDYSEKTLINDKVVKNYYNQLQKIAKDLGHKAELADIYQSILRLPDVLNVDEISIEDEEWKILKLTLLSILDKVQQFRAQEGKALEKDFLFRISNIEMLLKQIDKFEKQRIENIKERITAHLNEFLSDNEADKNRLEQEIIYYIEKLDITEEKIRLSNHCTYFLKTMKEEISAGKKLHFIAQEIGREINTIGSKANNSDIQKIVVQMKDELEKIKEQLMNIL